MDIRQKVYSAQHSTEVADPANLSSLCEDAKLCGFNAVSVFSSQVEFCVKALEGSGVMTCVTVGAPYGAAHMEAKAFEAALAVRLGAVEVHFVINHTAAKNRDYAAVKAEAQAVFTAVGPDIPLIAVVEPPLLSTATKVLVYDLLGGMGIGIRADNTRDLSNNNDLRLIADTFIDRKSLPIIAMNTIIEAAHGDVLDRFNDQQRAGATDFWTIGARKILGIKSTPLTAKMSDLAGSGHHH